MLDAVIRLSLRYRMLIVFVRNMVFDIREVGPVPTGQALRMANILTSDFVRNVAFVISYLPIVIGHLKFLGSWSFSPSTRLRGFGYSPDHTKSFA